MNFAYTPLMDGNRTVSQTAAENPPPNITPNHHSIERVTSLADTKVQTLPKTLLFPASPQSNCVSGSKLTDACTATGPILTTLLSEGPLGQQQQQHRGGAHTCRFAREHLHQVCRPYGAAHHGTEIS